MKGIAGVAAISVLVVGVTVLTVRITAASSAQPLPVAYGFDEATGWQRGTIRPDAVYFGAGGSLLARDLHWSSWTQQAALGEGVQWADNCAPNCAAGSYRKTQAMLTLSRVRVNRGVRYFTRLTMLWTANGKRQKLAFRWARSKVAGVQPFWQQIVAGKRSASAPLSDF